MGQVQTDQFIQNLAAASLNAAMRSREALGIKAFVHLLNLNAVAPVDLPTTLAIPSTRYIPLGAYVYDPSGNVAAATLGLYTGAGGTGTEIIAPTLLATLTATGKFQELSIAALTDLVTAATLIPRLTIAAGAPGTASLVIECLDLSLI